MRKQKSLQPTTDTRLIHIMLTETSSRSIDGLLHELQAHQIELETQIDELHRAYIALEKSHAYGQLIIQTNVSYEQANSIFVCNRNTTVNKDNLWT